MVPYLHAHSILIKTSNKLLLKDIKYDKVEVNKMGKYCKHLIF